MRNRILTLATALAVLTTVSFAQAADTEEAWVTHSYDEAIELAKESNRLVLVEFTGSDWCPPCIALTKELLGTEKFKNWGEDNVIFLYLDFPRRTPQPADLKAANQALAKKFSVRGFPTVLLLDPNNGKEVDRISGFGRGGGDKLFAKWKKLVQANSKPAALKPPGPKMATISDEWFEGSKEQRERLAGLETAPALQLTNWVNSKELNLKDLQGKVVVLDFWATWCTTCQKSIASKNALYKKYRDQGVVFIGIAHKDGGDKLAAFAKERGIEYPVAVDATGATFKAFKVNGVPDYYMIDRAGKLRVADVRNSAVGSVVKALAREPVPGSDADKALKAAEKKGAE